MKKSNNDQILVVGAGITLSEALRAATDLASQGVGVRVLDPFTIKPLDREAVIQNARECGGRVVTVEDHYPEGGLGEAVLSAVAEERDIVVRKIAVPKVPRSGSPEALLDYYGLSAKNITKVIQEVLKL